VYRSPQGKLSRYGYINDLEELIIDLLVQDNNNGEVFLPKSKLFRLLNLNNDNYNHSKYHIPKLSIFTEISEDEIYEFYDLSKDSFVRSAENALNKLKKKSLVLWNPVMTVCIVDPHVPKNTSGTKVEREYYKDNEYGEKLYRYKIDYRINQKHREATKEERLAVLEAERKVMDDLNCFDKQYIVRCGLWDEFKEKVKNIIFESHNIVFYYESYRITFSKNYTQKAWSDIHQFKISDFKKRAKLSNVNNNVRYSLNRAALKRHDLAMAISTKESSKIKYTYRKSDKYILNNSKLIETLINSDASIIKKDLEIISLNTRENT
jgi:hypothetical protein